METRLRTINHKGVLDRLASLTSKLDQCATEIKHITARLQTSPEEDGTDTCA